MGMAMVVRHGLLIKAILRQQPRPSGGGANSSPINASAQRSELTDQLTSLTIRRDLLNQQLARASGQSATDLQAQLRLVDQRVKQTTSDLDRIDQATHTAVIANTPDVGTSASGLAAGDIARMIQDAVGSGTSIPGAARVENIERVVIAIGALNGLGIVLMLVLLWRSMRWPRSGGQRAGGDTDRLEHLQRAVDVIAVEVERISESQRFAAKLANANPARDANAESGLSRQR